MIYEKMKILDIIFDTINHIFMIILIILTIYPLWYVFSASLSDPQMFSASRGIVLKPLGFTLEAYKNVLENRMIGTGYLNTLIYVAFGTTLNMLLTAMGAYALSRKNLKLKKPLMLMIIFTMYFNGGLIPTYLLVDKLNLVDTRMVMIVLVAVNTIYLIIMRTAFEAVPASMEESARMDGATDITILFRIFIPLSMPVIAVMILYYGVYHWNSYFNAMIYLRKRTLYPLQIVLREILIMNDTDNMTTGAGDYDKPAIAVIIKYACIIVATVPVLFVYPFLQKYFVKGIMIGAVKE